MLEFVLSQKTETKAQSCNIFSPPRTLKKNTIRGNSYKFHVVPKSSITFGFSIIQVNDVQFLNINKKEVFEEIMLNVG